MAGLKQAPNLVEAREAGNVLKRYPALLASIEKINSLPTERKKYLINQIKKHSYDTGSFINVSLINSRIIPNIKHFPPLKDENSILNLFKIYHIYGYLLHKLSPNNKLFNIPEIKDLFEALLTTLSFNTKIFEDRVEELLGLTGEIIKVSAITKEYIINNYKKIFVLNNIIYLKPEIYNSYNTFFLTNFFKRNTKYGYTFNTLTRNLLSSSFNPKNISFKAENLLITNKGDDTSTFKSIGIEPIESSTTHHPSKEDPYAILEIEELKQTILNNLSKIKDLDVIIVNDEFFESSTFSEIESSLFAELFTKDFFFCTNFKGLNSGDFNKKLFEIGIHLSNTTVITLDTETKVSNAIMKYNPENPFPNMLLENGAKFSDIIDSKSELIIAGSKTIPVLEVFKVRRRSSADSKLNSILLKLHTKAENYSKVSTFEENGVKTKISNFDYLEESEKPHVGNIIDISLYSINFGDLKRLQNLVSKIFSYLRNNTGMSYSYLPVKVRAYNLGEKSILGELPIDILLESLGCLLSTLRNDEFINQQTFDNLLKELTGISEFLISNLKQNLNLKNIYVLSEERCVYDNTKVFNMYRAGQKTNFGGGLSRLQQDCNDICSPLGEVVLRFPEHSIKAFGNKAIKTQFYEDYMASSNKSVFLLEAMNYFSNFDNILKLDYTSNSLVGKGFDTPVNVLVLTYKGDNYKFLVDDFAIEIKDFKFFKADNLQATTKVTKKLSISIGKTRILSKVNIPNKCNTTDPLLVIENLKDNYLSYNSGKSKNDLFIKVRNEVSNKVFTINTKHIKVYEKPTKSSKSPKK